MLSRSMIAAVAAALLSLSAFNGTVALLNQPSETAAVVLA